MKHNILKSLFLATILMAGTSNVLAGAGLFEAYLRYNKNGSETTIGDFSTATTTDLKDVTTLSITGFWIKTWCNNGDVQSNQLVYQIYSTNTGNGAIQYQQRTSTGQKNGNDQEDSWTGNITLVDNNTPSSVYYFKYYFEAWFNNNNSNQYRPGRENWNQIKYTVLPPSVKDFTVTPSGHIAGSGTQLDPYIVKPNGSLKLTLSGSQTHTDANSSVQYNTNDTWNTTNSKTISNITSTTPTSVTVKARYNNSTASLSGTESSATIWYAADKEFNVTATATSGGLVTPTTATLMSQINGGDITAAPKPGYTFTNWTIATGAGYFGTTGTSTTSTTANTKFRPTQISTLLATFTPITYTIIYNLNGGSGTMTPTEYNVTTETFNLPTPTRTGYTFDGWYSDAEFTGEKVTTIAKGTTGDITLYAKWIETKYSVNIYTNDRKYGTTTPSGANWVGATPIEITATQHTGYHFEKWTATGGASIADLNSATTTITATASGTVTAHFAESLYDITVLSSNDTHGTVSQSAPKAGITTAITITAEPMEEEYEFTGWSKTGDITIASINSATTTLTATSEGTITANFSPKGSTPIYFKANHAWTAANAWFAVYYWNTNNEKGWSILNPICGSDYYKAEVPAGYTGFKFVRMRPSTASGYKSDNGGLNWTNPWNQSGDLVVPTDGKTMFDTKKVYLKPNDKWKTDNMRFAAYFYDDSKNEKWMSLELTSINGVYTCDIPTEYEGEKDYKYVIFCRMDPSKSDNNWSNCKNKTVDLQLFDDSEGIKSFDKNCYTIWNDQWGKDPNNDNDSNPGATGYWSLVNDEATYGVTLYSCSFGEYGFIYNNVEYTSPESGSITYQIPVNATVKVFSRPYSKEYRGDVMVNQSGTKWEITPDNPLLNITCHTILDDNYKTIGEHEVYLAVPHDEGSTTWWYQMANHTNYLYAFHDRTKTEQRYSVKMEEVGIATVNSKLHTYYRCVIPAEVNTIRFEKHKTTDNSNVLQSIDLRYDIPLNSVNCYRLDRPEGNKKAGVWEQAPGFGGDFRLVHHRALGVSYSSDIIRKGTISQTVSLHIYTVNANAKYPKLELQQQNANGEWVPVSGQTKLVKDINKIMSDQQDQGCGVWNFTVTTDGGDYATVNFDTPQRYTGNYYIRTNNAEGEWRNYTLSTNHMTFSSYAKNHSEYTHYFCRYIDVIDNSTVPGHNKNVKFIIANDYAAVLSNEMTGDEHTTSGGDLPESANVRWTWNELDNTVSRAYILGSHGTTDHIVANGKRLNDQEDWIYEIDLTGIKQGDKLNIHADYPSKDIGTIKKTTQTFADNLEMIKTDPSNQNSYTVRVMYDFKINKTLIMLLPDQVDPANIGVDVFIERTNQGKTDEEKTTQVKSTVTSNKGYTVYSTLKLTKEHLTSTTKTEWERLYYWISFPFDVRISEIFGFGEYGKHYIIEYYDGAERAKNGCWADSPTYWRQIKDTTYSPRTEELNNGNEDANGNPNNGILVANRGYVLALARNIANSNIFKHGNDYVRLYFPSREKIKSIDGNMQDTTVYLRPHTCTIEREDRNIYDSNWHIIGVPSYANKEQILKEKDVLYFYTYNTADNTYNVTPAENASGNQALTFKSMHAYMVQYAGYINWKSWSLTQEPQSVVARRQSAEAQEDYALRLELQRDGQYADQAFVQLKAEGATADFDMNQDLTKIINAGANIYTLAGEKRIQVAGNVLPIAKTTIPVGIQVAQAGTYTIALPDGTSGISATLVDNQTGTHTNLLLEDYTITLDAGSHENRFYIVLDPERSATALENIGEVQGDKAQKFLIDGQLIIRTEQGVYDATGNNITNRQ